MKIYLSGPMTGMPGLNRPMFELAESSLVKQGHEVVNPLKVSEHLGVDAGWEQYMRADIKALLDCDEIMLLKGWEKSRGAQLEMQIAHHVGMVINFFDDK
jgi:hypothetical protein